MGGAVWGRTKRKRKKQKRRPGRTSPHTLPLALWTISPSRRLGLAELSAAVGADSSLLASQHCTRPTQARIVVSPIAGSGSPPAWARRCCCRCFAQLRCVFEFPILILAIVQWHGRSAVVRLVRTWPPLLLAGPSARSLERLCPPTTITSTSHYYKYVHTYVLLYVR